MDFKDQVPINKKHKINRLKNKLYLSYSEGDRKMAPFLLFQRILCFFLLRQSNALLPKDNFFKNLKNTLFKYIQQGHSTDIKVRNWAQCSLDREQGCSP